MLRKSAGEIGRKFSDVATDAARSQEHKMMGAMGGMIGKAAFLPDVAGAEAGVNLARGDKLGAAVISWTIIRWFTRICCWCCKCDKNENAKL